MSLNSLTLIFKIIFSFNVYFFTFLWSDRYLTRPILSVIKLCVIFTYRKRIFLSLTFYIPLLMCISISVSICHSTSMKVIGWKFSDFQPWLPLILLSPVFWSVIFIFCLLILCSANFFYTRRITYCVGILHNISSTNVPPISFQLLNGLQSRSWY